MIGWAYDSGADGAVRQPALAAAKIRIKKLNAKGGAAGHKFVIKTCDTQNNNASKAKSCALSLLGQGANILFTTCDVDFATPVVQEAINRGKLAVAPCIGTDQMGPKRFGTKGKLAFSFGNVAQDEGSAMAEYAYTGAGRRPASRRTRCSSTSRTSCRRSTSASPSSAARSSRVRATRRARTTSTRPSGG